MDFKDLMTWPWGKSGEAAFGPAEDAYRALQSDINRALEMFLQQVPPARLRAGIDLNLAAEIRVDVCETDDEIEITAELPGIAESDIEVSLLERMLIISGEKKPEHGMEGRCYRINERTFGRMSRAVPLPANADEDGIVAVYRDGVLKVTMPRLEDSPKDVKKIDISKG